MKFNDRPIRAGQYVIDILTDEIMQVTKLNGRIDGGNFCCKSEYLGFIEFDDMGFEKTYHKYPRFIRTDRPKKDREVEIVKYANICFSGKASFYTHKETAIKRSESYHEGIGVPVVIKYKTDKA